MVSPQPKLPSSCPKLPSSLNEATVVRYLGQTCLPSSRGNSFGDYCTKTRKGTSLSFWCKVYNASVFLCSKFERDRWSQRGESRQKLLEASGRVGAILTTLASRGCPQWLCPNEHTTTTLHMHRPRWFQLTWFGVNRPSGCWVMASTSFCRTNGRTDGRTNERTESIA